MGVFGIFLFAVFCLQVCEQVTAEELMCGAKGDASGDKYSKCEDQSSDLQTHVCAKEADRRTPEQAGWQC